MKRLFLSLLVVSALVIGSWSLGIENCYAAVPGKINYQGKLTDASGQLIDGTKSMTFKLYTAASGGSSIWDETHSNVQVTNGLFNVMLGSTSDMTTVFQGNDSLYLEIKIGTEVLSPRQEMASVGYALRTKQFDSSGNLVMPDDADIKFSSGAKIERDGGNIKVTPESGKEFEFAAPWKSVAQPCAKAYHSGQQNIDHNTEVKLTFDTEVFDLTSEFDTNNNRFVAAKTGYYFVYAQVGWKDPADQANYCIMIKKNGDNAAVVTNRASGAGSIYVNVSNVVQLNAGQYVEAWVYQDSGELEGVECDPSYSFILVVRLF